MCSFSLSFLPFFFRFSFPPLPAFDRSLLRFPFLWLAFSSYIVVTFFLSSVNPFRFIFAIRPTPRGSSATWSVSWPWIPQIQVANLCRLTDRLRHFWLSGFHYYWHYLSSPPLLQAARDDDCFDHCSSFCSFLRSPRAALVLRVWLGADSSTHFLRSRGAIIL
jgi:hypothetical protein